MTPLNMYLLILVSKLPDLGMGIIIISICTVIGALMLAGLLESPYKTAGDLMIQKKILGAIKIPIVTFIFGVLLSFFGVDMKQIALIYGVPAAVNNEQVQKLPNNVLNLVNTWLEEQNKSVKSN